MKRINFFTLTSHTEVSSKVRIFIKSTKCKYGRNFWQLQNLFDCACLEISALYCVSFKNQILKTPTLGNSFKNVWTNWKTYSWMSFPHFSPTWSDQQCRKKVILHEARRVSLFKSFNFDSDPEKLLSWSAKHDFLQHLLSLMKKCKMHNSGKSSTALMHKIIIRFLYRMHSSWNTGGSLRFCFC